MSGCLNDPEASVPEEIECIFEWAKRHPLSTQLHTIFCRFIWVDEVGVPFTTWVIWFVMELTRRTVCESPGAKVTCCIGKQTFDGPRVIPVVMTTFTQWLEDDNVRNPGLVVHT